MLPHTTAFMGVWRGLPTAGGRGPPFSLLPALARQCRKGAVQLWFTKTDDEPGSSDELCKGIGSCDFLSLVSSRL
jgi:hypothetical protein